MPYETTQAYREYADKVSDVMKRFHELCLETATIYEEGKDTVPEGPNGEHLLDSAGLSAQLLLISDLILLAPSLRDDLDRDDEEKSDKYMEGHVNRLADLVQTLGFVALIEIAATGSEHAKDMIEEFNKQIEKATGRNR